MHGKLVVLDIAESGRQMGEKLLILLATEQRKELAKVLLEAESGKIFSANNPYTPLGVENRQNLSEQSLTELQVEDLHFCLEQRLVTVRGQEIGLTVKEFDILALLIMNPKRVFTYDMLMDLVWNEDYSYYSRKAVNNHVSNLRKKLRIAPDIPDYIKNVVGVGYKFDSESKKP